MRNTIIITSVLFVAVVIASVFYFSDLQQPGQRKHKPFTLIPADAAFLVSFKNDGVLDDLFAGYPLFEAILGNKVAQRMHYISDSLLRHPKLAPFTEGQEVLISFHHGEANLGYLMALSTNESLPLKKLISITNPIDTTLTPYWVNPEEKKLLAIPLPNEAILYVANQKGVLLASFSESLLKNALNEQTQKLTKETIARFRKETTDSSPLHWHLNHDHLFAFASHLVRGKPGGLVQLLEGLRGQSTLRMNFKSDALIFSGASTSLTDTTNYLSLLMGQQPIALTLQHTFPATTATYLSVGISDFRALHKGILGLLASRNEISQIKEQHRLIQQSTSLSIDEDLLPNWGDEFAVIELANQENVAIIKVKDSLSFADAIHQLSTAYPENVYRLNHSNLLYYSFGDPLKKFQRPYFMVLDQYMVCANHPATLRRFQADYSARKMLATTPGYVDFEAMLANKSNLTLFVNSDNAKRNVARGLKEPFKSAYTDTTGFGYQNFYGWSIQLSGTPDGFFTNFYAKYINREAPGAASEWAFNLNGALITDPVVCQYDDTSRFILAQDASHILHAISTDGKKIWNAQLPGPILDKIQQLADRSIVVTTSDRLYRLDPNGDALPGFSIQLPHKASYGATVFEDAQQPRIFIPSNNRILAYDGKGDALPSWKDKTTDGNVLFELRQIDVGEERYLVAATDAGQFYYFDQQGKVADQTAPSISTAFKNPLGVFRRPDAPEAPWVATTDTSGVLYPTTSNNTITSTAMGNWSATHTFDAVNIVDDPLPELIFADNGQLSIYRYQDSSLVFHYDFGQPIAARPKFFPLPNGTHRIGVATSGNHLLYLFNTDGTLVTGFPTEGGGYFYYGKLQNNGRNYLLSSKNDRKLYCFPFE